METVRQTAVRWLWQVTGKRKAAIAGLTVLQMVLGVSGVAFALALREVIDAAAAGDPKGFGHGLLWATGIAAGQILLRAVLRHWEERTRADLENACKRRLFGVLLHKDYASVTAVHSGEWLNRLTSDTAVCAAGAVDILPGAAGMAVKLLAALSMMLVLEPGFVYLLLPGGAVLLLLTCLFRKTLKALHKQMQTADGKVRVFLQEHLESLLIVRSFSAERRTLAGAEERMDAHRSARMARIRFSNLCNSGFSAAMNGMYLLGLGYCGYGILQGKYSYGTLMAVLQLIGQLQMPLAGITGFLPKFYAMTASAERLSEAEAFAEDCPEGAKTDEEIRAFYENGSAGLGFAGASFAYRSREGERVLENISVILKKGSFTAITGHSGCGKSTLLKLLMCLYPLQSGERFLIGKDGTHIPLTAQWHRLFAYVPQGSQLLSGSIGDAVSFSEKAPDEERLARALHIACADFAETLGTETQLGERGQGLSEGQLQRLAIARAIYSDAPVLLLDESTSALDGETEQRLLCNLRQLTDKTVILVTHRPAALDICDTIIHMHENGVEINDADTGSPAVPDSMRHTE